MFSLLLILVIRSGSITVLKIIDLLWSPCKCIIQQALNIDTENNEQIERLKGSSHMLITQ
jgi:hypothetical protein